MSNFWPTWLQEFIGTHHDDLANVPYYFDNLTPTCIYMHLHVYMQEYTYPFCTFTAESTTTKVKQLL